MVVDPQALASLQGAWEVVAGVVVVALVVDAVAPVALLVPLVVLAADLLASGASVEEFHLDAAVVHDSLHLLHILEDVILVAKAALWVDRWVVEFNRCNHQWAVACDRYNHRWVVAYSRCNHQ